MVSADDIGSPPPLTPPRSLPPPPIGTTKLNDPSEGPSSSYSYNPSLLIIAAILAFVCIASASIHLLLRFFSRSSSSSSSSSPPLMQRSGSATTATSSSSASDQDRKALLDSLPLFSLASSLAVLPKSSPDCAVCLSRFQPHDELRLLPSCRHAFHSPCIDTWIRSTPSCPLCRSSINLPPPRPPPPPTPPSPPAAEQNPGTGSFRLEIGSVSRRRPQEEDQRAPPAPPPHPRSYPLGPSFEYQVEEEVEAVVSRLRRRPAVDKQEDPVNGTGPLPPGADVADAVGGTGKAWLKEYVDRLASSASSSFSSLRFSSRRFDGGGGGSWDLEGDGNGEETDHWVSYRWLTGAPS